MSSAAPLIVLLALGGGVLATARLAKNIKRQREGFVDHDSVITTGQERYNALTSLLDIMNNPFVGPTPGPDDIKSARKDIRGTFSGVNAKLPSVGAPMSVSAQKGGLTIPADTKGMRTFAVQKCEKIVTAKCSAFDDPEFAKTCGICFKPGTDSQAQNRIGGLYLDSDDKTAAELQSQSMGERRVNYRPTVGTCPPGFFVVNKASCEKLEKRIDCEQKKTYGIEGCSQCYTDGSYTIVDASVPRADISLFVSYIGNLSVTLTGSTTVVASASSTSLGDNIVSIGQVPEGSSVVINVDGPGAILGGYIQGPTVSGNFQVEIAQLADADLESGIRPRFSGEVAVGGNTCIALRPARGKTKMSLRVNIPMTFVDPSEYEASTCTGGPFLTKEASAKTLSAGTCFARGNAPGSYSMDCLQEKFVELGCTSDGKGYPRDAASVAALNTSPDGKARQIGDIADFIYENSLKAATGISSKGEKQTLLQWNDASVFCSGKEILNACDAAQITGTMTSECMGDLWANKGLGNRIGATYTGNQRNSSLTGQKDRYCGVNGLLSPFGPDGKPQQDAIQRAFTSGGTIQNIKDLYDQTHRRANDNSLKDADRKEAIKDCYGVSLNTRAVAAATVVPPDQLKALKAQYDAIMNDLNYLYGVGLGPASGNDTFNDRYAKKIELDKKVLLPIKARYVRIRPSMKPGPNDRCLQISQLQVFNSSGQEIARGRPTSASSILGDRAAKPSMAVDGNAAARPYPQMFHDACDTAGQNQFWMVDLGSEQDLSYIVYYNRIEWDCCNHRADGMPVELLDGQMNVVGITKITGTGRRIQVNFTVFDKQNLPWNNLA